MLVSLWGTLAVSYHSTLKIRLEGQRHIGMVFWWRLTRAALVMAGLRAVR